MAVSLWTENTIYKIGDVVSCQNQLFKCLQTHQSIIPYLPSKEPRLWTDNPAAITISNTVYDWKSGTYYFKDDYILFMNVLYICNKNHISTPFTSPPSSSFYNSPPVST
jgi:hypothetical protein